MTEPSPDEITRWKQRLESREFQQNLLLFQENVYRVFEDYRRMTGNKLIRVVFPRHTVKSLESVIDKIRRKRQQQTERPKKESSRFDFHMVDDLIGAKVLCPYESSAKEVIRWMWNQEDKFRITPRTLTKAFIKGPWGYRGWHFTCTPVPGREPRWIGVKCEVQVKTMLQEAWDAQTHDTTYKREGKVARRLLRAMLRQSNELHTLDRKGENLRKDIQRVEEYERKLKDAAAAVFFWKSTKMLKEMQKRFEIRFNPNQMLECTSLPPSTVSSLNRAIEEYVEEERLLDRTKKKRLSGHLGNLAGLLAVCQKDPAQESMAMWLVDELVNREPGDPDAEDFRAGVLWGLDRLEEAVASGSEVLRKCERESAYHPEWKVQKEANLCYWVADLARAGKKVTGALRGETLDRAQSLLRQYPNSPGYLDTVGFVKICLGGTREDIAEGLRLVRKAYRIGMQSSKSLEKKLALPFRQRHEAVAKRRLEEMG